TRPHGSYFHPVYGIDSEILTDDFPADHIAHRGIYWGWPHMKVGETEYDGWGLRGIKCEFRRWLRREVRSDRAILEIENAWVADERDVLQEKVSLTVWPASKESRCIDVELTWTPTDRPITL